MKQVQDALKNIGIPVMAGVWRATTPSQNPPLQYAVYSTTMTEASHQDDQVTSYRTFVYLNLWSDIDPTEMANRITKRDNSLHSSTIWKRLRLPWRNGTVRCGRCC